MHKVVTHSRTLSSSCSDSYFLNQNRCRFRLRVDVFLRKSLTKDQLSLFVRLYYIATKLLLNCMLVMYNCDANDRNIFTSGEKRGLSLFCVCFSSQSTAVFN